MVGEARFLLCVVDACCSHTVSVGFFSSLEQWLQGVGLGSDCLLLIFARRGCMARAEHELHQLIGHIKPVPFLPCCLSQ